MKKIFIFFFIASSLFAQLKNSSNQADYIIIYHPAFEEGLTDFINWREAKGYNIKPVSVETIYEEFPDSSSNSEKIKEFINYAYNNWENPKPKYVLLVGDVEFIPSNRVKSNLPEYNNIDSVSLDQNYVLDANGENLFMALGRIPCSTNNDLKNVFDKIKSIEDEPVNLEGKKNFVVLSDVDTSTITTSIFEAIANEFIVDFSEVDSNIFNLESYTINKESSNYISVGQLLQNELDDAYILSYYGHANPFIWSHDKYLSINDFDKLIDNSHPFVFTALSSSQHFDLPDTLSIIEKLLFFKNKGTVLSITASGSVYLVQSSRMFEAFYKNLLKNAGITVGNALMDAINSNNSVYIRRYTLLGDPALKLPLQVIADVDDSRATLPSKYVLEQNYPNPFNPTTIISYQLPVNSFVKLKIYDALGKEIITLVNKEQTSGTYNIRFNASNLASGIYLYSLETQDFKQAKKMILMK